MLHNIHIYYIVFLVFLTRNIILFQPNIKIKATVNN